VLFSHLKLESSESEAMKSVLTYLLTPWSRVLLENLTGLKLVKKFPHFMETEVSLPHSRVPVACPFLRQLDPLHNPTSHFLKIHRNIILPFRPGSPKWSLSLRFLHQTQYTTLLSPYSLHHSPISLFAILSP